MNEKLFFKDFFPQLFNHFLTFYHKLFNYVKQKSEHSGLCRDTSLLILFETDFFLHANVLFFFEFSLYALFQPFF